MEKGLIRKTNGEIPYYISKALEETGFVRHGFSTRRGGVSEGVFASMNLGRSVLAESQNIRENRKRFCGAIGVDERQLRFTKQAHGDRIFIVSDRDARMPAGETCDGFITALPGVPLMVFTADCVPVLLLDPVKMVVAAVHCGWRGTALDMAGKAVRLMKGEFGSLASDIIAAIGPSIMPCHFLTDNDVADAMYERFGNDAHTFIERKGEKWAVDLPGINGFALMREGVQEENITLSGLCTACDTDEFYSHRIMGFERGVCAGIISLVP